MDTPFQQITGKVFLGPMAKINDIPFRILCSRYGSAMNFTPMISTNAIERKNKANIRLAATDAEENFVAIQLYGSNLSTIKNSVRILEHDYPDIVKPNMFDFNFCCPVEKIIGQGAGCALLKRPKKIGDIISCIRDATDLPVSAKIRLGINEGYSDFLKTAKVIEDSGADMLIVHGRYQDQKFSGEADWDAIRQIKEHVNIPVVGNGDIFNEHKAQEMLTQTGCDYIMVSRAAIGNPFIFSRINHFLDTGEILEEQNKFDLIEQYFELARKSITNNSIIKNQLVSFTKTIDNSSDIRRQIMKLSDVDECMSIIRANAAGRQ